MTLLLFLSLFIVSFGQGGWIPYLGIGAASFGYALFWRSACSLFPRTRDRFWLFWGWFVIVQAIQLSWFTSTDYMGPLILVVYAFLLGLIGLQFGCLAFFFKDPINWKRALGIAGCWTLFEWSRLFFFSGFTWNPVGLSLADPPYAIQFASLFGVYGLSFWVIFVNAMALCRRGKLWSVLALIPYLFGVGQMGWVESMGEPAKNISVALVQTGILPEQKDFQSDSPEAFIHPLHQWERIWTVLEKISPVDLIVLPEAAVSLSVYQPFYFLKNVKKAWEAHFGTALLEGKGEVQVSNAFLSQMLANHFQSNVIVGFDSKERSSRYNSVFLFKPGKQEIDQYNKRVLVPVAEYVPFPKIEWLSDFLVDEFGIGDSFDLGKEAELLFGEKFSAFKEPFPIGVSICVEETYSHLIRDFRRKGAELLVNVSNDVWFPRSRLPKQHFQHGQIRAAENGVYVLRSCNTGITGAIDCFGRVVQTLPPSEKEADLLYLSMPVRSFSTLYTWWGDSPILILSLLFFIYGLRDNRRLSYTRPLMEG